jgi:SP family arabinose:H+ symporter-like MFS transporter
LNKRLITAVYVGSLGGFVFGYDLGALSAATASLRVFFDLTPWVFGLTISSSVWGTVCGSILAGRFADKIDRLNLVALCSILYAFAAIGVTLHPSSNWLFFIAMRVLGGLAIGGFTVGCPLYLSEIAPTKMRGRVVGLFQVQVGAGVIVSFSVGAVTAHLVASSSAWTWVLGLGALPAMVLLLLVRLMPQIGPEEESDRSSLSTQPSSLLPAPSVHQRLFRRRNTRLILVATSIAVFNQLSGVNILLLYMLEILASAGMGFSLGHTYTVLISCLSLLTTLAGMAFVDRLGRKPLLYIGSAGMAVALLMLGLAIPHHLDPLLYLSILVAYNAFFAFSQGTVVWVYLSELFPPGLRGLGQGYGSSVHWIANALLVSVFPRVQHASTVRIFYIFALMMAFQIVVIWLWYPETKGTALGSFAVAGGEVDHRLR